MSLDEAEEKALIRLYAVSDQDPGREVIANCEASARRLSFSTRPSCFRQQSHRPMQNTQTKRRCGAMTLTY